MVTYEELSQPEKDWVDNWINGIAWFIAKSPNESPKETAKEYEEVKKILEEKRDLLVQKAVKWRKDLLRAFGIE